MTAELEAYQNQLLSIRQDTSGIVANLQDRIRAGEEFEVERLDQGEYRLVRRTARPNEGVVDWLLSCPEKVQPRGFSDSIVCRGSRRRACAGPSCWPVFVRLPPELGRQNDLTLG